VNVTLSDSNGEIVNVSGYNLYLANLIDRKYAARYLDQSAAFVQTSGAGATGGTFEFFVDIPVALDHRTLRGLLGNQDRSVSYTLSVVIADSATVYSVAPTTLPTVNVDVY